MAQQYHVNSLKKLAIASIVAPGDFRLGGAQDINFEEYLTRNLDRVTPYCIDLPRREVLFVEAREGVDLVTCKPFFYEGQRCTAGKVIRVSFDELHQVVRQRGDRFVKPIFLYSTGRCGSTLLCNLMGDCSDVVAISEPDYFTQLPFLIQQQGGEVAEDLTRVTRNLSVLLLAHVRVRYPKGEVVFKLRSQCNEAAELIQCAFPDARNIFLYRNVVDTVNSFCSVLRSHPMIRLASVLNPSRFPLLNRIPVGVLNLLPVVRSFIRVVAPLSQQYKFATVGIGTGAGVFILAWLSGLDKVLQIHRNNRDFFKVVLRYEELREQPLEVVSILLGRLGLPAANEEAKRSMAKTLRKDSQKGSELASSGEFVLSVQDEQLIERAMQAHAVVNNAHYQLPGSVHGERV